MRLSRSLVIAAGILLLSLGLRLWPLLTNNFYFTADQGQNALVIRDMLVNHQFPLRGPETSIRGIFAGPLWYYFLAIGYFVFAGDPRGGVIMLALLNVLTLGFLILWLGRRQGLIVSLSLAVFWPFYLTSAWAFNPFPTVALTIFLFYFLQKFLAGRHRSVIWALLIVFLSFSTDLASATALWLFTSVVILYSVLKKQTSRLFFLALFFLPLFFAFLINGRSATYLLLSHASLTNSHAGLGVFNGTNFAIISGAFLHLIGALTIPQAPLLGILFVLLILYLNRTTIKRNSFVRTFSAISLLLLVISYSFFSLTRGWKDWQTVYLAPLLFLNLILILSAKSDRLLNRLISIFIVLLQFHYSLFHYLNYPGDPRDPSLLRNRLQVIDYLYQHAAGEGFAVFTYTKSYYDYPQQYLFWWYGLKKYHYLPCQYANLPGTDKTQYVPSALTFAGPVKDCQRRQFLLIESPTNGEKNQGWIDSYRAVTELNSRDSLGGITIEEHFLTPLSDILFDSQVYLQNFWDGPLHLMLPNAWSIFHRDHLTTTGYGSLFSLVAQPLRHECFGQNLSAIATSLSRLNPTYQLSSYQEERLNGIPVYRFDLSFSGTPSQIISLALFRGTLNDYEVKIQRQGSLLGASHLVNRILNSTSIIEDPDTEVVTACPP